MTKQTRLFQVGYKVNVFYNGRFEHIDTVYRTLVAENATDAINKMSKLAINTHKLNGIKPVIKVVQKDFYPFEVKLIAETNI